MFILPDSIWEVINTSVPKASFMAIVMVGGHWSMKMYMEASKRDCKAPMSVCFGSEKIILKVYHTPFGLDVATKLSSSSEAMLETSPQFPFQYNPAITTPAIRNPTLNSNICILLYTNTID